MSTAYKPRSGTFRKVKYPLKIYKTHEIPANDIKDVFEMADKIQAEETLDCAQYQFDEGQESKEGVPDITKRMTPKLENLKLSPERTWINQTDEPEVPKVKTLPHLPEAQFSAIQDKDNLYNQWYANDDALPPFPVTSPGISFSDAEKSEHDSDYDMDTEDEEWLEANDKLNITPNRLEYMFSKLNKRNTHVENKAIGALPEAFHRDFHHIFPYWKQKRLQNKNVSSFKPKGNQTDAKTRLSGYITSDPYVIFRCNPRKSLPQQHQSQLKVPQKFNKRNVKNYLERMLETRKRLQNVRAWALETFHSSIAERDEIVTNFASLLQNHGNPRSEKENPSTKFAVRCSNEVAKNVKLSSASNPLRASGRLTTHREKVDLQETPVASIITRSVPLPVKKKASVTRKLQEEETQLIRSKQPRKLPTFKRIFNGTWKNKGNHSAAQCLRIQTAMP